MTVVLVGSGDRRELPLLAGAIEERGGEVLVCDVREWPGSAPVAFEPGREAAVFGTEVAFEDVTGAYVASHHLFHPYDPRFGERLKDDTLPALRQLREYRGLFESLCGVLEDHGADVVVPLRGHYLQDRKPWQLHCYALDGVPIPDTLFTNDPDRVRAFHEAHDRVLYKPVTRGAIPRELTEADLDRLDRLATAPVQFQEFVEGEDLRVYVLDGEVVAAVAYESDYYSFKRDVEEGEAENVDVRPVALSGDLRDAVCRATECAGLTFAAADVRRRSDGSYALLELNEAPRFAAPDVRADQDVAGALAEYLL